MEDVWISREKKETTASASPEKARGMTATEILGGHGA